MNWETFALLIAREGLPIAAKIAKAILSNEPLTTEAIDALLAERKTAEQIRAEVRAQLGVTG